MNKFSKVLLSIFGGVNFVFSMYIPIAVALLSIKFFGFNGMWTWVLLITGIISTLYRAINVAFVKQ